MQQPNTFTIYNASAGSGKTFTLVKDYLKILFLSKNSIAFKNILALTFTNKAVAEMKGRIIYTLKLFSDDAILITPNSMFKAIVEELNIEPKTLHEKSKKILHTIVHNYAAFDVSTIDKFNHKLIRTFAYDLKLPLNFEVELDSNYVLGKAVDKLIDKAGTNKELTQLLVDFAIEKADDDKSWDIAYDFNNVAKLLVSESDLPFISILKEKSIEDFKILKSDLAKRMKLFESQIKEKAQKVLTLIDECGLQYEDFSRKTLPNHFLKLIELDFYKIYENQLQNNIAENTSIYTQKTPPEISSIIDSILPQIEVEFLEIKSLVFEYLFVKNCLKNVAPLSVLNAITNTLQELKDEDNFLLISEFNSIINTEINAQPTPFIYERLGEKFKHYFIDEFQDTSELQWHNLIPLIDNALSGENLKGETGTAMLVGDAKQAIYRWRGGKSEQFINLYNKTDKPFVIEQNVKNLPVNYRSTKTIVDFNNMFFNHISDFAFSNEDYAKVYKNSKQDFFNKDDGYIELSFLETKDENKDELFGEKVLQSIHKAIECGYNYGDICIITRKNKEGVALAEFLSNNNISIVSSESLLLKNAPEVNFLINVLKLVIQPKNNELKIAVLNYIATYKLDIKNAHAFYSELVQLDAVAFFNGLKPYGFDFNFQTFSTLPIYEATETVLRQFNLNTSSNAYLQFFLDEVLDYSQKMNASYNGFIEYWERRKDKLSIVASEGDEAVQIMTIHKSKGLEFPVVIFPYANQNIYFDMSPKIWFPVNPDDFNGFSFQYINLNKDLENYNELGAQLYNEYQSKLELDAINLLYVVLTRAINQLYIISEYDLDKAGNEKLNFYSGLFINYIKSQNLWESNITEYIFGSLKTKKEVKESTKQNLTQSTLISTQKEDHNLNIVTTSGYLWDTEQEKAIEKGNLVHNIMAHIKTESDIEFALDQFMHSGKINSSQEKELKPIIINLVNHNVLKPYFNSELTIYNEKDIITREGQILRPDRVVINSKNEAVIIDYKTGLENSKHKEQLYDYQYQLENMNFKVTKKILIYINDTIEVKEF